ncbi:MAG: hypothetical protein V7749_01000 [Cocleimonas sp.]
MKQFVILIGIACLVTGCVDVKQVAKERYASNSAVEQYNANWHRPNSVEIQTGTYSNKVSSSRYGVLGNITIESSYHFENGQVVYNGQILGKVYLFLPVDATISSKADYQLDDGFISFTNVVGDGAPFPLYKMPYEVIEDTVILYDVNNEGAVDLTLLAKVSE